VVINRGRLLAELPVADVNIAEPPIEEIISEAVTAALDASS
jgi:hypothetical protein